MQTTQDFSHSFSSTTATLQNVYLFVLCALFVLKPCSVEGGIVRILSIIIIILFRFLMQFYADFFF